MIKEIGRFADELLSVFDSATCFFAFTLGTALLTIVPLDLTFLNTFWGRIVSFLIAVLLAKKDVRLALIWVTAFVVILFKNHKSYIQTKVQVASIPGSRLPQTQELDLDKDFPVQQTPDGVSYQITDETEVGKPLHPDLYHSGPQSLGDPLPGYEPESNAASF